MSTHYEDEAQVEQLRRWWSENWVALTMGLALGLIVIFGWQTWNSYRETQRLEASRLFDELREDLASSKLPEATAIGKQLIAKHASSAYAVAGQLTLARAAVGTQDFDQAREGLSWVVANSKDPGFKDLARLRLARVLWQLGKLDDALAQLTGNAPAFDSLYSELRGDLLLAKGDPTSARSAYQSAVSSLPSGANNGDELQHKIDALPVGSAPPAPLGAHS